MLLAAVTEWSGGLYVSPTIAGSRPGGLIAGAWAAMMSLGLNGNQNIAHSYLLSVHRFNSDSPLTYANHISGYLENTRQIMEVSKKIEKGYLLYFLFPCDICKLYDFLLIYRIKEIPELFVVGHPHMTVIAFGSNAVNIFEVNDIMTLKGWHLNALQRPNRWDFTKHCFDRKLFCLSSIMSIHK